MKTYVKFGLRGLALLFKYCWMLLLLPFVWVVTRDIPAYVATVWVICVTVAFVAGMGVEDEEL